jgi:hypothetical protein
MVVIGHPFYTTSPSQGHGAAGDAEGVVILETP